MMERIRGVVVVLRKRTAAGVEFWSWMTLFLSLPLAGASGVIRAVWRSCRAKYGRGFRNRHNVPPVLPEELIFQALTFLDVSTLIKKKQVSRTWRQHCTNTINAKRTPETAKVFETNIELRKAVVKYTNVKDYPVDAEEFAQTYGYPIGNWDVSRVNNFSHVFCNGCNFNENINDWDVSNATTMHRMFCFAEEFNKPLSNWNTSKVKLMAGMFEGARAFNQNISNFDTSQVTDMGGMFEGAQAFNQDLSNFNTSHVTNMCGMFCGATSFNQSLSNFDVSQVTDMEDMFYRARDFNQNISNWDTSQVTDATDMFVNATSFHRNHAPTSLDPTIIFETV